MSVHLHHLVAGAAAALFLSGGFLSSARAQPDDYLDAVWCGTILGGETRPGAEAAREAARRIAESHVESGVVSEEEFNEDLDDATYAWILGSVSDEDYEQEIARCIRDYQYR